MECCQAGTMYGNTLSKMATNLYIKKYLIKIKLLVKENSMSKQKLIILFFIIIWKLKQNLINENQVYLKDINVCKKLVSCLSPTPTILSFFLVFTPG